MRPRMLTIAALVLAFALPGFAQAQDPPPVDENNMIAVLQEAGEFNTLLSALEATGLTQPLSIDGPFTLFAPTDAAFEALPDGTMEQLMQDPEQLQAILAYHIIPGEVSSTELAGMNQVETAFGMPMQVQADDTGVQVDDAQVTGADTDAANGMIHTIDSVLMPPQN